MVNVFHPSYTTDLDQKCIFLKNIQTPPNFLTPIDFYIEIGISMLLSIQYNIDSQVQHKSYPMPVIYQPPESSICDPCAIMDHFYSLSPIPWVCLTRLFIRLKSWDELMESLPSINEAFWVQSPACTGAYLKSSTSETEAEWSGIQGYPWLHQFKASLKHRRLPQNK